MPSRPLSLFALVACVASLVGQTIPEDQVPKEEHAPLVLIEKFVIESARQHGLKLPPFAIRRPTRQEHTDHVDTSCSIRIGDSAGGKDPVAVPAEFLVAITKRFDDTKIWRVRRVTLQRAAAGGWVVQEFSIGSRCTREGEKVAYATLPRCQAVLREATARLAAREERVLVSVSIDFVAEDPVVVAGYLMRSKDPEKELRALVAELEILTKDAKKVFRSVRMREAQTKDVAGEDVVRFVELLVEK